MLLKKIHYIVLSIIEKLNKRSHTVLVSLEKERDANIQCPIIYTFTQVDDWLDAYRICVVIFLWTFFRSTFACLLFMWKNNGVFNSTSFSGGTQHGLCLLISSYILIGSKRFCVNFENRVSDRNQSWSTSKLIADLWWINININFNAAFPFFMRLCSMSLINESPLYFIYIFK